MKKILCIVLIFCWYNSLNAQVIIALLFGEKLNTGRLQFGIEVTPSLTDISNIESKVKDGLNLGIYLNIKMKERLLIHVEGVAKGTFGAKSIPPYPTGNDSLDNLFAEGSVTRKIKAFSLPVMLRYGITDLLFIDGGIQPNMLLGAKDIFKSTVNDNELNYTKKINEQITLLDFGLTAGFEYKFSKAKSSMGIGIRYFGGIVDIDKAIPRRQANSAWLFNITIPIGTGKAAANSKEAKK